MKKTKLFLLTAFIFLLAIGCSTDNENLDDNLENHIKNVEYKPGVGTPLGAGSVGIVPVSFTIGFTNEATIKNASHTYTIEDFPEVRGIEILDMTTMYWVIKQIEAERTGDWSEFEAAGRMDWLLNLETFRRMITIKLEVKSNKEFFEAVELLEKRTDVDWVSPQPLPPALQVRIPVPETFSGTLGGLGREIEWEIRQDYAALFGGLPEDASTCLYLGTYNNFKAIYFDWMGGDMITKRVIGAVSFVYPNTASIIVVWIKGNFYMLEEAYAQGWLTQEDLTKISNNFAARWAVGLYCR